MNEAGADWDAWFEATAPALVLFARQWADSQADAEDIVQDVLVRFWHSGRKTAADPRAYLFASVKRAALDFRRGRARRKRREDLAGRHRHTDTPLFESTLERDEFRDGVEAALARLPEGQREALVMKVWGGLTFPQIAAVLGVPPNTAASRYRYALEALRRQFASEPVPSPRPQP